MRTSSLWPRVSRGMLSLVLAGVLTAGGAGTARADCCDSLFGCAAAYVTDGLSCVLQEIVDTIRSLVDLLDNLSNRVSGATQRASDAAVAYVKDTIASTRAGAGQAVQELEVASQGARRIYADETSLVEGNETKRLRSSSPPPTATPTPVRGTGTRMAAPAAGPEGALSPLEPPAPHGALGGLFEKAVARIAELEAAGKRDAPKVLQLMDQAQQTEGPALQSALSAADQAINAPIRNLLSRLNDMLSHPTSAFDPTDIVNQLEQSVLANLDTNVGRMVDAITAGPDKAFGDAQPAYDEIVSNAALASAIVAAMKNAYTKRTQASRIELSDLLPRPSVGASSGRDHAATPAGAGAYGAMRAKFKTNLASIAPEARRRADALTPLIARLKAIPGRLQTARSMAPTYRGRFVTQLGGLFANKTRAEIDARRDELVAQARTRFASDPKTRDAVIDLLRSEAGRIQPVVKASVR